MRFYKTLIFKVITFVFLSIAIIFFLFSAIAIPIPQKEFIIIIFIVVALTLWVSVNSFVLKPINNIIKGTKRISLGDLDYKFSENKADEIGTLGCALNRMVVDLKKSDVDLQELIGHLDGKLERTERESADYREKFLLSERMSLIGKLSELFAHEIDNPLLGIFTYIRQMKKKLDEDSPVDIQELKKNINISEREIERAFTIVRNLFEFIRKQIRFMEQVDIKSLIEDALLIIENHYMIMNIKIEKNFEKLPQILGDPAQLKKAFFVILYNAMKAMLEKDKRIINISSYLNTDERIINVLFKDTGKSIKGEKLANIFDPFFIPEKEGEQRLSLSTVKEIVADHGGKIDIKSMPEFGNLVIISLPIR